jgi:hypothetical protein
VIKYKIDKVVRAFYYGKEGTMGKKTDINTARGSSRKSTLSRLWQKCKGFFSRLLYIIGLVWQTSPAVLIAMCLLCILDGVLPVIGAYITKYLMNGIAVLIAEAPTVSESISKDLFVTLRVIVFLFILEMVYLFLRRVFGKVNTMVTF